MPKGVPKTPPFGRTFRSFAAFKANDRGLGHEFWLFHGVNYLSGNPFPGIYKGDRIYRGVLFAHIMERHLDLDGRLTRRGQECLLWSSTLPEELFRASLYIKAFSRKYGSDPQLPGDPYVQVAVETVAGLMVDPVKDWGRTEPLSLKEYYSHHRRYARDLQVAANNVLRHDPRTRYGWEFWAGVHREVIARLGLPPGIEPFRLEYKERNDRGYLMHSGWLEDKRKAKSDP